MKKRRKRKGVLMNWFKPDKKSCADEGKSSNVSKDSKSCETVQETSLAPHDQIEQAGNNEIDKELFSMK